MKSLKILGIPVDILLGALQLVTEVVKLFTPNHESTFQKPLNNNNDGTRTN